MKSMLIRTLSLFLFFGWQIGMAQHFVGEIKYAITSIALQSHDTITYFFDKDIVLIKHAKGAIAHGGSPYEICLLAENRDFYFDNEKRIWFEFPNIPNTGAKTSALDSIGTETLSGHFCKIYEFKSEFTNEYIQSNVQHTIWVSEDFPFKLPENWTLENKIFANGTGKIVLKSTMLGTTTSMVSNSQYDSTLTVSSISTILSEEYYKIIADFQKWRGK